MKIRVYDRWYSAKLPVTGLVVPRGKVVEVHEEEGKLAVSGGQFFPVADSVVADIPAASEVTLVENNRKSSLKAQIKSIKAEEKAEAKAEAKAAAKEGG